MTPRRIAARLALATVLVAVLAAGCGGGDAAGVTYRASELRTGKAVSLESLSGKPLMLTSWATWCKECDEVLGGLQSFSTSAEARGLTIVAVNLDAANVDDEINAKVERHHLDVILWRDQRNAFKRSFGALGVPTTVLIDRKGRVIQTFPGAVDFADRTVLEAIDKTLGP